MNSRRFLCILPVLLVVDLGILVRVSLSFKNFRSERIYKHGDIILGGLFPLHLAKEKQSCSDLRSNVLMYSEAMIYAVDEINRNGTILPNVMLGYDIRDTCGNDQEGVTVASDFVYKNTLKFDPRFLLTNSCVSQVTSPDQAPILAVIGGLDSRVSVNVANVLQTVDIPQISYGASSAELASSAFTSFFRTVPADNFQSKAMSELVAHYQWTCVAVIGVDDWYGRSGVDAFVKAANETGTCIVMRQLFPVHDSEAFIEQMVTRLKDMDHVQIIILYSLVPQAIKVFEEALKQGMTGRTWIASDGWAESSLIQQERFKPIIQGAVGFGFHSFPFEEFKAHVVNVNPLQERGPWWNEFWEKEFNCSSANISSPLHEPCSGQEKISLEKFEREYSHGIFPYVRDAVYSVTYALRDLLNCSGQGPSCSERAKASTLRPNDLLTRLKTLSFKGLTGQIDFQNGEVEAAYDIFNLQETPQGGFELVKIGSWNAGKAQKINVQDDLVQWHQNMKPRITCGEICNPGTYRSTPNQCFWECVPCDRDTVSETSGSTECTRCPEGYVSNRGNTKCEEVPVIFVEWDDAWGVTLSVLTVGCVILTLVFMAIVVQKRNTPIIQDTGGILNVLLLVMVMLSYAFNFIHLSKLSDQNCRALPPIFYCIYTGAALLQFLKVYRIRALLKPPTPPTPQDRNKIVLAIVVALWLLPIFAALLWIIVDPPEFEKHIDIRLVVYAICKPYKTSVGVVLRYFCAGYLLTVLIAAVIVAYSTKGLPHGHRFDEAKHLSFSLTVFGITYATFYPGWTLLVGPSLTVFACLTNLVAATGTLFCLFAPKLWLIYRFPRHNTQTYVRPNQLETRRVRSSTLLSIGNVAIALGAGHSDHPVSILKSSPSGSPAKGTPRESPFGTPNRNSPSESARSSPTQRGANRRPAKVKIYVER